MTKYELVNPSDAIVFEAENDKVASVSTLVLGNGYGAQRCDNGEVPFGIFLFGLSEEGFQYTFGESIGDFLKNHCEELSKTLLSYAYVREQTSMQNIVKYAHQMGERFQGMNKFPKEKQR